MGVFANGFGLGAVIWSIANFLSALHQFNK
jgi:hypothetical protein